MEGPLGTVEENIVPVGGVEVFDGFELEAGGLDLLADLGHLGRCPELVRIAGNAPRLVFTACGLVLVRIGLALTEIVDQMNDDVRAAGLNCEREVFVVQHVPVETKTEFHFHPLRQSNSGGEQEKRTC